MKKISTLIFVLVLNAFAFDTYQSPFIENVNGNVNKSISSFKKEKAKEKLSYSELMNFLENSGDKNKIMILGILYATDSKEPDDYGEYIKSDIALSQKYLLQSYNMGSTKSLSMLGGLIFYNDNMAKLDPKLILAEKYLWKSFKEGYYEGGIILANVQLVKGSYSKGIQTLLKLAENGESSAQLELALIFQKGIYSDLTKKVEVEKDRDLALIFLNKACSNKNKSKKVNEFCYSDSIVVENK